MPRLNPRWRAPDPGWGRLYGYGDEPQYVNDDDRALWMFRRGQKVRFYDARGHQFGPEQSNVAPAAAWAYTNGFYAPGQRSMYMSSRTKESRGKARENPVQQVIQSHVYGPSQLAIEWVDVQNGQWATDEDIDNGFRRPPREPGNHLVAPGAQIILSDDDHGARLMFSRTVFVKHHGKWKFLQSLTEPVRAKLGTNGMPKILDKIPAEDEIVMGMLLAYALR